MKHTDEQVEREAKRLHEQIALPAYVAAGGLSICPFEALSRCTQAAYRALARETLRLKAEIRRLKGRQT